MLQGFYYLAMRRQRRLKAMAALGVLLALGAAGGATAVHLHRTAVTAVWAAQPTDSYLAKSEDGRITIYRGDVPYLRTDIDIRTLPQSQQQALSSGIPLADAAALARLLENDGS